MTVDRPILDRLRVEAAPGADIEARGPADALTAFASAIEATGDFDLLQSDERSLRRVEISPSDGAVSISAGSGVLMIQGTEDALASLAATVRFVARGPAEPSTVAHHAHIESYPGHEWIAPESEPLVVVLDEIG